MNLHKATDAAIDLWIDRATAELGYTLPVKPTFDLELTGTTAGTACYARNHISLNSRLFRENTLAFIERTIPHEFVHLLAFHKAGPGIAGHGPEWQGHMLALGLEATRCHQYSVASRTRPFVYGCPSCDREFNLSVRHHNGYAKRLPAVRLCPSCRVVLEFKADNRASEQLAHNANTVADIDDLFDAL